MFFLVEVLKIYVSVFAISPKSLNLCNCLLKSSILYNSNLGYSQIYTFFSEHPTFEAHKVAFRTSSGWATTNLELSFGAYVGILVVTSTDEKLHMIFQLS